MRDICRYANNASNNHKEVYRISNGRIRINVTERRLTMGGCHYTTLGVTKNSSTEDIKAAFRKLSKETHPDVAGPKANPERFRQISEAASVLSSSKTRQIYDLKMEGAGRLGAGIRHEEAFAGKLYEQFGKGYRQQRPTSHTQVFVSTLFRPRNLLFGTVAVLVTAKASSYMIGDGGNRPVSEGEQMVQAWRNPRTQQWETPAPWDPTYRQMKPVLELVPREQVKSRTR